VKRAFRYGQGSFVRCRDCASLFDSDARPEAGARRLYEGKEYFVKDSALEGGTLWGYPDDYLADRGFIEAKFDRVLANLERYAAPGRLLDVGSGPGFLLTAAGRRGWSPVGLDLNEWAVDYGRGALGVEVRRGALGDDGVLTGERFDAMTMMDLIEHVPDPDEILAQAGRLIRPGGVLALLTPDAGSVVSRLLGRRWPEVRRPGEHLVLFSVQGLTSILARHGFTAIAWHSIGKRAPIATLVADASPLAPRWSAKLRDTVGRRPMGQRVIELDPRTKFCLYARLLPHVAGGSVQKPARVRRRNGSGQP